MRRSRHTSRRPCEVCGASRFDHLDRTFGLERCLDCQLIRIDPPPSDAILDDVYRSGFYERWTDPRTRDRIHALKKATLRRHVLPVAGIAPGMRVLDCGAAMGALMELVAEAGADAYGIERSPVSAAAITERFGKDRVFRGLFEEAVFPGLGEGAFDVVVMCDFIEHVRDPVAVLRRAADWLMPGGRIVLTTPDSGSWTRRVLGRRWPHYKVEHLFYFNGSNLEYAMTKAGLRMTVRRPAQKVVDLAYVRDHAEVYSSGLVWRAARLMGKIAQGGWNRRPRSLSFGEQLVVGARAAQAARDS